MGKKRIPEEFDNENVEHAQIVLTSEELLYILLDRHASYCDPDFWSEHDEIVQHIGAATALLKRSKMP